jgi:hypothetical protein
MLLDNIHHGSCGHQAGPRTLVGKAFEQGFYWPTAVANVERIIHVTEPTNYMKLRKSLAEADNLANLSPYNLIVYETMKDFKPTNIQTKIVQV